MNIPALLKFLIVISSTLFVISCGSDSEDKDDEDTGNPSPGSGVVKAFPTAEGFGANATGGRGGSVIKVTNLNASGAGSLQAALNVNEARIIVFEVSGVIEGFINIPYGDLTIAAQTAPGAGITIHGVLECDFSNGPDNIIIRHLRIRGNNSLGPSYIQDAVQCARSSNMIFDHVAISGGVDEAFDLYESQDVTVQWSSITRSEGASKGNHNLGMLNGPDGKRISIHHNLMAHHNTRAPAVANGPAEVINNVIYNVGSGFVHHNPATGNFNIVGNYYKEGPSTPIQPFFFDDENGGGGNPSIQYYMQDNYVDDPGDHVGSIDNPWATPLAHSSFQNIDFHGWNSVQGRVTTIHDFSSINITTTSAESNYDLVLDQAGAFPRDKMAKDNVQEVEDRTGDWGARIPADLMQGLTVGTAPTDSDGDGMPDNWENAQGLDSSSPDHNTVMPSGYTAIEDYINELADELL